MNNELEKFEKTIEKKWYALAPFSSLEIEYTNQYDSHIDMRFVWYVRGVRKGTLRTIREEYISNNDMIDNILHDVTQLYFESFFKETIWAGRYE